MNVGVVIMRAQPFHIGHIYVINEMLRENDHVLIVVGSANKSGTVRNPLDIDTRLKMIEASLSDSKISYKNGKVSLMPLCDWSMENAYSYVKEWGNFLYYNVVNAIGQKTFRLYYNDDIAIAQNWFVPELSKRVELRNTPRGDINVSGTQIREALLRGDDEYLSYALTPGVFKMREIILQAINDADDDDFIMK